MRSHSSEHRDSLPVLDITALRHIAYVVDGIVYYMRSGTDNDKSDSSSWTDADENENDDSEYIQMNCDNESIDDELSNVSGSRHTFFQRSESTLCLGCPPPEPFNLPMNEALPLADQPHLLHPNASREDLFGIPKQPDTLRPTNDSPGSFTPLELPPTHLGMSSTLRTPQANQSIKDDSSNEVTLQEDQVMAVDVEEKVEKSQDQSETKASTSFNNQNVAGPSTSKETSTRQAPEGYNIYMQLKKKTYFDFYENDKRTDGPQDLSKAGTESKIAKMELDGDTEMENADNETRNSFDAHQKSSDSSSSSSSGSATIRPQIIVSPRKSSAFAKTIKSENSKKESFRNDSSSSSLNASNEIGGGSSSGSPSKSVIVRVGSSVSLVCIIYYYFELIELDHHKRVTDTVLKKSQTFNSH